jgi:hypothetical protein
VAPEDLVGPKAVKPLSRVGLADRRASRIENHDCMIG